MTTASFGKRAFIPTPPDKGSFPIDHDSVCKEKMTAFMNCLKTNKHDNSKCRFESMEYLNCRMENNLMAREPWSKLGLEDVAAEAKERTHVAEVNKS